MKYDIEIQYEIENLVGFEGTKAYAIPFVSNGVLFFYSNMISTHQTYINDINLCT